MLDVYRNYYGLSGEPFRLGPDYRFSLHHASYANAKAYLEFAIYQGEGFIAITGGPGTGKTTLISEILAGLDREKVEVATLTSTQLESRDLLQMVASSFGLRPDKVEKADLLLEIESFLVSRIRGGHRAILIVDEAQGLSPGALEELRLLANLQYQYQLLLQVFLVGQESLLKLIRAPGMEHLQQRLVAATSLDPLSLDETIDYIEHRLSRVAWKGEPAIDEAALRLVYQYSGGVPRRINLIANRLFLYGGMQQKQRMNGEDARAVIDGLIEEFLLPPEPPIAEADIGAPPAGEKEPKPRCLPRTGITPHREQTPAGSENSGKPGATAPPVSDKKTTGNKAPEQKAAAQTRPRDFKLDSDNLPGSRRQSRTSTDRPQKTSPGVAPGKGSRQPSFATRDDVPPAQPDGKAVEPAPKQPSGDKKGGKGFLLLALLLAGAGGAYLLDGTSVNLNGIYTLIGGSGNTAVQTEEIPDIAAISVEQAPDQSLPVEAHRSDAAVEVPSAPLVQTGPPPGDSNQIIRTTNPESVGGDRNAAARSATVAPAKTAGEDQPTGVEVAQQPSAGEAAARGGQPARGDAGVAGGNIAVARISTPSPAPAAAIEADREVADAQASATSVAEPAAKAESTAKVESAPTVEAMAKAEPAVKAEPATTAAPPPKVAKASKPVAPPVAIAANHSTDKSVDSVIQAQRARLRTAAEERFSKQVARAQDLVGATPVAPALSAPEQRLAKSEPPAAPPAAKKKPGTTPDEVKKILLDGRWSSGGKPATLLPSELTYCNSQVGKISCVSVPQNVKTQYGLALYKVETTLNGFSAEGLFEMSYRTLVKLVGSDSAEGRRQIADADKGGWQISEYAMSCKLSGADQISCVDGKGISRRYQRAGLAGQ